MAADSSSLDPAPLITPRLELLPPMPPLPLLPLLPPVSAAPWQLAPYIFLLTPREKETPRRGYTLSYTNDSRANLM